MNPAFLDNMSWEIAEVYGAVTDQILINLSRYFRYYSPGDKIPRTAFEYQAQMLAQIGKVNRDTIRIIRNGLEGADDALKSTLEQAIIDSVSKSQPELLKGVKQGVLLPQGVPVVAPNQMRAFELYYKQSADRLNLVNTVMLESTKSAYQQTISDVINDIALSDKVAATYGALDVAAGETITGVSSWNTALRHATDKLKNRGITGFIDHAGRQWSAEAYVAMDVRTTTFNVGRSAVWEQNQDFGNDLYLVSYHNGARPGCYDWQNKVISSLNVSRDVVDLDGNTVHVYAQSDTTYGQPAGLFGINCKHYPTPFIPGVSVINGTPQSPEENEKTYKESQEQRRLERKLREEKRDYLMAKEQGASPEELSRLKDKTRKTSQDIDDFCDQTGRARHRDREAVYTKREFPDKEKYDVSAFKNEQQKAVNEYFKDGGAQREFTAGQMTPNEPLTPKPSAPVAPVAPVAPQNVASQATQATPSVIKTDVEERAEKFGVGRVAVTRLSEPRTEQEIINAVGGGDKTSGSCASLGFAYAGQKAGYDVLDFRGGKSQGFFSSPYNLKSIAELPGIDGVVISEWRGDFAAAHQLLKKVEDGKEYYLSVAKHAAVVRKGKAGLEYLELQTTSQNGWHALNDGELAARFGCRRNSKTIWDVLIDVDKLGQSDTFAKILEFINTNESAQMKGVGGYAK